MGSEFITFTRRAKQYRKNMWYKFYQMELENKLHAIIFLNCPSKILHLFCKIILKIEKIYTLNS